jgi:hypothetical protein
MRPQKPTVLVVAESAQLTLIQMRDQLRLLSRLTETGTVASAYDNLLRPDSLAWWFSRLARDLEEVLGGIRYDHEVASRHTAQRSQRSASAKRASHPPTKARAKAP